MAAEEGEDVYSEEEIALKKNLTSDLKIQLFLPERSSEGNNCNNSIPIINLPGPFLPGGARVHLLRPRRQ